MSTATDIKYYESGFPKSIHRQNLNIPLNDRLRYARERKKLTLAMVTKELNKTGVNCALSTVQSYEISKDSMNRRYPSIKMLISLANLYDCSTDFLLGISEEPNRYTPDIHKQFENNRTMAWKDTRVDQHQKDMIMYKIDQIMAL
jgi:transcriptional regulator with XRE-family HTH domain